MTTEDQINEFFEKNEEYWPGDYNTQFFKGEDGFNVDDTYKQYKYKTRVIAFIYDKSEYKEEVKQIK